MKKICTKCGDKKLETEFNFRNKILEIRNNCCRECTKGYYSKFYTENKAKEKARATGNTVAIRQKNRQYLIDYLQKHPCIDCNESDIIVLDFDHVRGIKHGDVTSLAWRCYSIKKIQEEIDKCDIRCANCHRRKTSKQKGHYKYLCSIGVAG